MDLQSFYNIMTVKFHHCSSGRSPHPILIASGRRGPAPVIISAHVLREEAPATGKVDQRNEHVIIKRLL